LLFIITNTVGTLIPGPAAVLSIKVSLEKSKKVMVLSSLGLATAGLIIALISILGLGAILVASEKVFLIVKIAGALFLLYLGITSIISKKKTDISDNGKKVDSKGAYLKGFFVGMGNPNAILFFIAVFPQLFDMKTFSLFDYFICLSALIVIIFFCMLFYSLIGTGMLVFLKSEKKIRIMNSVMGIILIFLGLSLFI